MWLEHGYRWSDLTLRFDSQAAPPHPLQRLGFSRTVWLLDHVPFHERVERLLETRPQVVVGTPTALRRVCELLEARGAALRPRIVFSQGEVLPAATRTQIERVFGVSPADLYGLTEVGYVAWQCERRGPLHVNAEVYVVEVLHEHRPAVEGELGRVVITDLRGRTMPLLRYDTGDLAVAAEGPCECGRPLPLLGRMEGRADGALVRSDGEIVTTRAVVDALGPDGFRVRQDTDGTIELQVAPGADAAGLSAELEALLGAPVSRTTAIRAEPEAEEKTRWVVSEL
jgi:phenylacetate-CoA ligase